MKRIDKRNRDLILKECIEMISRLESQKDKACSDEEMMEILKNVCAKHGIKINNKGEYIN